jgi:hypothetical protein
MARPSRLSPSIGFSTQAEVYVQDFPGSGPAFVLQHGFPDNSHIYDDLIPHLAGSKQTWEAGPRLGNMQRR